MSLRPTAVNPLPSARDLALGKADFTVKRFDGASLSSVALGKGFAECMGAFAECMGHSAKRVAAVVILFGTRVILIKALPNDAPVISS